MTPFRPIFVFLAALSFSVAAAPIVHFADTWHDTIGHSNGSPVIISNAAVSFSVTGLGFTPAEPYNVQTEVIFQLTSVTIASKLGGDNSDPDNPITSTYVPGGTS